MLKYISNNTTLLLIVFILQMNSVFAGGSEEEAIKHFENGEFEMAFPIFEELHILYPSDLMFTYYYGVCLTETGNYSLKTRKLLLRSSMSKVPADVYFYIGVNYHAQNNFEAAIAYYERFANMIKKKELKGYDVGALKVACENEKNPFLEKDAPLPMNEVVDEEIVPGSIGLWLKKIAWNKKNKKQIQNNKSTDENEPKLFISKELRETLASKDVEDSIKNVIDESVNPNEQSNENTTEISFLKNLDNIIETETEDDFEIPEELREANIDFKLTSEIFYSLINQFKNTKALYYFVEGWTSEKELNSILEKTDLLRSEYIEALTDEERQSIADQVLNFEQKSHELKDYSDYAYLKAREIELEYWKNSSEDEMEALNEENQSVSDGSFSSEVIYEKQEDSIQEEEAVDTTIFQQAAPIIEEDTETKDNSSKLEEPKEVETPQLEAEEVENIQAKEVSITEQEPKKESIKQAIQFKVQIGEFSDEYPAYRKKIFDQLNPFGKIDSYVHQNGMKLYTIGAFDNSKDAVELQKKVRQNGVKDAFVVVFYNGKRITLKEANNITGQ